ncbi:hypothetical protein GCM10010211_81030 [Streptomyces albospinus]|uniref:WD40 repeat domain-containing protein n=1 Tax=Streptomyces albospinus TaxID=285515 RepID=A0ABQ2VQ22_9ACTN|nr:hypothetical protein GCM10010211_81030 [Streptomyces albospinus]
MTAFPGPDGRTLLASAGRDGAVRIWDSATGAQVGVPLTGHQDSGWGHQGTVTDVAAFPGPDGRTRLATCGNDGTVRIWDPATGAPVGKPLTSDNGFFGGVAVLPGPDGHARLVTGAYGETVRIWDLATGMPAREPLAVHSRRLWAADGGWRWAAFAGPDGRTLLAASDDLGLVRILDPVADTEVCAPLANRLRNQKALAAFPGSDGRTLLATGDDEAVRIWDLATGLPAAEPLTGYSGLVNVIEAFPGPDGRTLLATGHTDGAARIWDPATAACVLTIPLGFNVRDIAIVETVMVLAAEEGILAIHTPRLPVNGVPDQPRTTCHLRSW